MAHKAFWKYHGIGNDFVLFNDTLTPSESLTAQPSHTKLAQRICHRHKGIGADGTIWILPPEDKKNDARMHVVNADGSIAGMCGNGLRCVAHLLYTISGKNEYSIETKGAGPLLCLIHKQERASPLVEIDMGPARFRLKEIPAILKPSPEEWIAQPEKASSTEGSLSLVSMGNPHGIFAVEDNLSQKTLLELARTVGPALETDARFPDRLNVTIASYHAQGVRIAVWERGVGITQACGTAACATAAVACKTNRHKEESPLTVNLPGGDLTLRVASGFNSVHMLGPAALVYEGNIDVKST